MLLVRISTIYILLKPYFTFHILVYAFYWNISFCIFGYVDLDIFVIKKDTRTNIMLKFKLFLTLIVFCFYLFHLFILFRSLSTWYYFLWFFSIITFTLYCCTWDVYQGTDCKLIIINYKNQHMTLFFCHILFYYFFTYLFLAKIIVYSKSTIITATSKYFYFFRTFWFIILSISINTCFKWKGFCQP